MKSCLPYDCVQTHDQNLYQVAECTCGQISVAEYNLSSINRLDEKTRSTSNIFLSRLQINPMICHNHFFECHSKIFKVVWCSGVISGSWFLYHDKATLV